MSIYHPTDRNLTIKEGISRFSQTISLALYVRYTIGIRINNDLP